MAAMGATASGASAGAETCRTGCPSLLVSDRLTNEQHICSAAVGQLLLDASAGLVADLQIASDDPGARRR